MFLNPRKCVDLTHCDSWEPKIQLNNQQQILTSDEFNPKTDPIPRTADAFAARGTRRTSQSGAPRRRAPRAQAREKERWGSLDRPEFVCLQTEVCVAVWVGAAGVRGGWGVGIQIDRGRGRGGSLGGTTPQEEAKRKPAMFLRVASSFFPGILLSRKPPKTRENSWC